MKKTKRLWALLLVMVMALGLITTAFAAPTIDSGRKASLSLYKYDITAASADGVWDAASYVSTGVQDDAVTDKLAQYAIQGVEFSYLRVASIRSKMTNEIFRDEMTELYIRKDAAYKESIQTAKALLLERIRALETGAADDPGLAKELQELSQALAQVGGKHVYSYLPKSVKAQVDAIVERLAQLPEVAACYDQWWQLKDEIAGYYGQNTPPRQPLTQRKEFRSLKNWIIREAEDISFSPSADSVEPGEKQSTEKTPPIRGSADVQPVGEAVSARHIPANAVMRLLHHMGQIFRTSMPVIPPALRIDSKRRRRLQEKRMAMGHKRNDHEDEQLHHVNDNTMR